MAERIDGLIQSMLTQAHREQSPLFALQQRWAELVGETVAAHTKPVKLSRGVLVIHARHAGDAYLLGYERETLLARLREASAGGVSDLAIRVGRL